MTGCADVCLDHGYDSWRNAFFAERTLKARKSHKCCECGDAIPIGSMYERASGKADGTLWSNASCAVCAEVRKAFVCGSWVYGQLWESINDGMFPVWERSGPIDCLAKLTTAVARDECRSRYAQWREDWELPPIVSETQPVTGAEA